MTKFKTSMTMAIVFLTMANLSNQRVDAQSQRRSQPQSTPAQRSNTGRGVSSEQTGGLVESLRAAGNFTKLLAIMDKAGLTETISASHKGLTLFAPDDDAFALLPAVLVADWNSDPTKARGWILPYILTGKLLSKDFTATMPLSRLRTFAGTTLQFSNGGRAGLLVIFDRASMGVGGSPTGTEGSKGWPCCGRVTSADHLTANGIYHVITFAAGGSDEWR